jgi:hypothetical protein
MIDEEEYSDIAKDNERLRARIAELETKVIDDRKVMALNLALIEKQAWRIAELTAALKPFADVANYFDNEPRYTDDDSPCESFNTFGDLRAARAALGEKE